MNIQNQILDNTIIQKNINLNFVDDLINNTNSFFNAFPTNVMGRANPRSTLRLVSQSLTGNEAPTVLVEKLTNANVLSPVVTLHDIKLSEITYELEFDDRDLETGNVNKELAIKQACDQLSFATENIVLTGGYLGHYVLGNSLLSQANITKSPVNILDTNVTATQILRVITDAVDKIRKATGRDPKVLVIDSGVYNKIGLANANIANFVATDYIEKTLGLQVYKVNSMSDVVGPNKEKYGACLALATQNPQDLQLVIGELPTLGKEINDTTYGSRLHVRTSFGGFVRLNPNKNAVQVITNLAG